MSKTTSGVIRAAFPGRNNAGLREQIRNAIRSCKTIEDALDSVRRRVALTRQGQASLRALQTTLETPDPERVYDL